MLVEIHGDHRVRAGELGPEDGAQADPAAADDDDGFADFDSSIIVQDPKAGGQGVGEQAADLEIRIGRHRGHPVLREDGPPLKGGDRPGMTGLAVPAVGCPPRFEAVSGAPVADDAVPGFDVADFGSDFADDGAGFVAEQVGQPPVGAFDAVDLAQL